MRGKQIILDMLFLSLFIGIFFSLFAGSFPFALQDEERYLEIAREMLASGNYITPHLNGSTFLDKPILFYWIEAFLIRCFGLHPWSTRLLPEFFGLLGCLFSYWSGVKLYNRRTGLLSALILMTSLLYFGMSHYADMDLMIAVLISCSLWLFIVAANEPKNTGRRIYFILAYVFAGFGFLTKGLIALAFPALIIGAWILYTKRWHILKEMHITRGLIIIALMIMPWIVMIQYHNSYFLHYFFYVQQFSRYAGNQFTGHEPFFFYIPVILMGIFPWTFFLFQSMTYFIKQIFKNVPDNNTEFYILVWPLLVLVFFSIPLSKTVGYIMPVFPPLAMMIARYFDVRWNLKFKKFFITVFLIGFIGEIIIITFTHAYPFKTNESLALEIRHLMKPQDKVVCFEAYYRDIPLYLNQNMYIVSHWNLSLPALDDWKTELGENILYQHYQQPYLINRKQFVVLWHQPSRVFVLVNLKNVKELQQLVKATIYKLGKAHQVELISNKGS